MQFIAQTAQELYAGSVDDVLGDRRERFLGEGFKRVTNVLTDIAVRPAGDGGRARIDATAGLRIDGTWSRKGTVRQRPHLSTIDAMVYGAWLAGLLVAHTRDLPAEAPFTVRSLSVKAGNEPVEDGLGHFPVGATEDAVTAGSAPGLRRTTADCRVGAMAVRVEVEHPAGDRTGVTEGTYATAEMRPGPWNDAPFGASHFGRSQFVTGVAAEGEEAMSADMSVTAGTGPGGAGLRPTMVDLFVAALQLGQVLLYRYDGIERAASHTLWMRTTSIALDDTAVAAGGTAHDDGRLRVALGRPVKLTTERGTWRAGRLSSTSAGMRLACNVAHLLP
ncbi:hypothetical protein CXR04_00570 [Streptomyces sp. CMB-StM0423]|nr:hypothetical protein CXR04_00570 [Streptomyces sp. CMB-StM0423]